MSKFVMPKEVTGLPKDQQETISDVMVKSGLLTASGEPAASSSDSQIPDQHKAILSATLTSMNMEEKAFSDIDWNRLKCPAARIGEAVAVVACTLIPGGPAAVVACQGVAHTLANMACNTNS
jgi:hypothetical protein